jgi:hypothetical protein
MAPSSVSSPVITALLEVEPDVSPYVSCPLCHTTHAALTDAAMEAGSYWQCVRCGQQWDPARLTAVAAYGAWVLEHDDSARRRSTSDRHDAPLSQDDSAMKNHPTGMEHTAAVSSWDNEGGPSSE